MENEEILEEFEPLDEPRDEPSDEPYDQSIELVESISQNQDSDFGNLKSRLPQTLAAIKSWKKLPPQPIIFSNEM